MKQLKVDFGLYIGENIQLFFDEPSNRANPVRVFTIELEENKLNGERFVDLFKRKQYDIDRLKDFCQKEREKMKQEEALINELTHIVSKDGALLLKDLLKEKLLKENHPIAWVDELLNEIIIDVRRRQEIRNVPVIAPIVLSDVQSTISIATGRTKDNTKYSLDGSPLMGKNRLVLAVVRRYVEEHSAMTYQELEKIFHPCMQGSCGVIKTVEFINKRFQNDSNKRFFIHPDEILLTADGISFAVSTQWGKPNIGKILDFAREQGYHINEE